MQWASNDPSVAAVVNRIQLGSASMGSQDPGVQYMLIFIEESVKKKTDTADVFFPETQVYQPLI